jgi:DNA polymerase-3 subunit epsilon
MLRQIILDTETTGIGHDHGHRLIEIGCIELIDRRLTGKHFHRYINPERKVDEGAFKVHGLSDEFLSDKPKFAEIKKEFVEFVEGAELVIHNAPFDVGFINAEFKRIDKSLKLESFCQITDTLVLAKQKHPGQRNSLDALCKRYQIDATDRVLHGALLDAQLLADVYLAITSGKKKMELNENTVKLNQSNHHELVSHSPVYFASEEELEEHRRILNQIQKKSGQLIWPFE